MAVASPSDPAASLLVELTRSFASRIALDELLPFVLRRTREVLGAESVSVLLLDPARDELYFPETSDVTEEVESRVRATRFPADRGIAGHVLQSGSSVHVPDTSRDPRFYAEVDRATGSDTRSLLCAPLRTEAGAIGVLQARNAAAGDFSPDALGLLDALADSIAIALQNASQYEQVRRSEAHLREEVGVLRREKAHRECFAGIVGGSAAMKAVFALMESALATDIPVLITGETGVGKEGVARAIHEGGARRGAAFVAVNCSALQETLLEGELFGVSRGAFTGAHADRPGLFEAAHGGTLFLDEIGEMSASVQAKLLRAIEEREIRRLGDTRGRKVDIRVIAATHRDLEAEVRAGRFREDLFYRIHVFPIRVPPLRERLDDVPALATHFLARASRRFGKEVGGLDPEALDRLARFDWPGNVRQLENEIDRAVAIARPGAPIALECLSESLRATTRAPQASRRPNGPLKQALESFERDYIEAMLVEQGNSVTETARALGLSRQHLHRRLKELGLR
jgi:Nif-specific regulatory protein